MRLWKRCKAPPTALSLCVKRQRWSLFIWILSCEQTKLAWRWWRREVSAAVTWLAGAPSLGVTSCSSVSEWNETHAMYILHYCSKYWVFEEITTFIQQGCIRLIKSDSKDVYKVSKGSLILSIHQKIMKNIQWSCTEIWSSTTVFCNNKKCFLKSALLWFLKIMWHWRLE